MILNKREVAKLLDRISHSYNLTSEEIQVLRVLHVYLMEDEPLLTFEEFQELFKCETKYVDVEHCEIKITTKEPLFVYVDRRVNSNRGYSKELGIDMNLDLAEHVQHLAYTHLQHHIGELKTK